MGTDNKPSLPEQQEPVTPKHEGKLRGSYFRRFLSTSNGPPLRRRLRFAVLIVISQLMLIALAVAWLVHMIIIAVNGTVYFVERNPFILWLEIAATMMIILFAAVVFITQVRRLGERRRGDDRRSGDRD